MEIVVVVRRGPKMVLYKQGEGCFWEKFLKCNLPFVFLGNIFGRDFVAMKAGLSDRVIQVYCDKALLNSKEDFDRIESILSEHFPDLKEFPLGF